jgi:hypothetical protein
MIKFLESQKVEFCAVVIFIISVAISFLGIPFRLIPLEIIFRVFLLLYVLRIFISFRQWKSTKGVSLINAYLNFIIAYAVMAMGFTFLKLPGYPIVTYNVIAGPHYYVFLIAIVLIFIFDRNRWTMYWTNLKGNVFKVVLGILTCLILFKSFDMSSTLHP